MVSIDRLIDTFPHLAESMSDNDLPSDDESSEEFMLTHVEAIANHAFGDDLIYVQRDEKLDRCFVYVRLNSTPDDLVKFDWIEYSQSLDFNDRINLFLYIGEYHKRDGQV